MSQELTAEQQQQEAARLVARGDYIGAEAILSLSCSGDAVRRADNLLMLMCLQDLRADLTAARATRRQISTLGTPVQFGWALMPEAIDAAVSGETEIAIQLFHHAMQLGVPDRIHAELAMQLHHPQSVDLSWLQQKFPRRFADQRAVRAIAAAVHEAQASHALIGARALQRDTVFGAAEDGLTDVVEHTINAVLQTRWEAYEAGTLPEPELAGHFPAGTPGPAPGQRLLICGHLSIRREGMAQENEVVHHYQAAAETCGLMVKLFDITGLEQAGGEGRLAAILEEFDPQILFWEPDAATDAQIGSSKALLQRRRDEHGMKLVSFHGDVHEAHPDLLPDWGPISDLILADGQPRAFIRPWLEAGIVLPVPGHPFDPVLTERALRMDKTTDLFFCGTRKRGRTLFVEALAAEGVNNVVQINELSAKAPPMSMSEYFDHLGGARWTFNNGHVGLSDIATVRLLEGAACGTLVFQFDSQFALRWFQPFIHYMPVANRDQAVQFARFFRKHPKWRERISDAALAYHRQRFAAEPFLGRVFQRLGLALKA